MDEICVGTKFFSAEECERRITDFGRAHHTLFWKRETKLLSSAGSRIKNLDQVRKELKYYLIRYACIAGGRAYKKCVTTGTRRTSTIKQNCPVFIHVLLDPTRQFLVIKDMKMEHNHVVSEEIFRMLPRERRLPDKCKEKVKELLALKVNAKLLQQQIRNETGKCVTLKDIRNLVYYKRPKETSKTFDEVLDLLKNNYSCYVAALHDSNMVLQGLFFQDKHMSDMFANFPEMLFFDGKCRLVNNDFFCYLFIVEDGNGATEIVGVGLLSSDKKEYIQWLVESFKENNPCNDQTRLIFTDKEETERTVFSEQFPNAKLEMCHYYVLKDLRLEVTPEKMKATREFCNLAKDYVTKFAFCEDEESYSLIYNAFKTISPDSIVEYYDSNWHEIRKEWTHLTSFDKNNLNTPNYGLESINIKVRNIARKTYSFHSFIQDFFAYVATVRSDRDPSILFRNPVSKHKPHTPEYKYHALLLPYAFEHLLKQMETPDIETRKVDGSGGSLCQCDGLIFNVTAEQCHCAWHKAMKLPCRHIMTARRHAGIDVCDEALIEKRWLRQRYTELYPIFIESVCEPVVEELAPVERVVGTTVVQREAQLMPLMNRLAKHVAGCSGDDFVKKEEALKDLLWMWEQEKNVVISEAPPAPVTEPSPAETENNTSKLNEVSMIIIGDCQTVEQEVITTPSPDTPKKPIILPVLVKKRGKPVYLI